MNVYDQMNQVCEAIRDSHEYKKMQEVKPKLAADKDAESMVKDFLKQKSEIELAQYQGKKPDEAQVQKMQKLYEVLQLNPVASEYIQNYIRFQMMLGDLIERQFLGGAYNPQLGAAISLVMMVIVLVCMLVMNRFGEGEEQAVML